MFNKNYQEWPVNIRFEGKFISFMFKNQKDAINFYDLVTFVQIYHEELHIIHATPSLFPRKYNHDF